MWPYSPALGCDGALDAWCVDHCTAIDVRARAPSEAPAPGKQPPFFCFAASALSNVEVVAWNTSVPQRGMCGSWGEYLRHEKMTRESAALASVLKACVNNFSAAEASPARAATVRALDVPMRGSARASEAPLHARQRALPLPASRDWLALRRTSTDREAAATCVATGGGRWTSSRQTQEEPYLLHHDLLPGFNSSRWWWGVCDDDLRHGALRPPRAALGPAWQVSSR